LVYLFIERMRRVDYDPSLLAHTSRHIERSFLDRLILDVPTGLTSLQSRPHGLFRFTGSPRDFFSYFIDVLLGLQCLFTRRFWLTRLELLDFCHRLFAGLWFFCRLDVRLDGRIKEVLLTPKFLSHVSDKIYEPSTFAAFLLQLLPHFVVDDDLLL